MPKAMIGALRVDLGLNSAAFEKGLTRSERRMARFGKRMEKVGKKLRKVGANMTKFITLPAAGAATAFGVAADKIAHDARDIANSAKLAGVSFEEFQKQAFAAKSVGIETEKLADIYKDMRDRVGDFVQTGGGPLKDFFENIAPKVGVTAEQFKNLSGPEALQLFQTSLEKAGLSANEMTFFMEGVASESTALLPLLKENGKAMKEIGEGANVISDEEAKSLDRYVKAQQKLEQSMQKLIVAVVDSGILDVITKLVEKFSEFTSNLADTNPGLLKAGVAFAGLAAALGPVIFIFGSIMTSWRGVVSGLKAIRVAALLLVGNPAIAAFALVVTGIYLAWKNWDEIGPILEKLYNDAKKYLLDKLGAVFNWVRDKIKAVSDAFNDMYVAVVGNSYVPDMVDGIRDEMKRLDAVMVKPAKKSAEEVKEAMRDMAMEVRGLLDELFPEVAAAAEMQRQVELIRQKVSPELQGEAVRRLYSGARSNTLAFAPEDFGEASGIQEAIEAQLAQARLDQLGAAVAVPEIQAAMEKQVEALKKQANQTEKYTGQISDSFENMATSAITQMDRLVAAIKGGSFFDIVGGLLGIGANLGSLGLFGQDVQKALNSGGSIFGGFRADGGPVMSGKSYIVGERGPELFTPRNSGSITPNHALGGGANVTVTPSPYFDVAVDQRISNAAPSIAAAGSASAISRIQKLQNRSYS